MAQGSETDYGQEEAIAVFGQDPRIYQTTVQEFLGDKKGRLCKIRTVDLSPKKNEKTGRMDMVPVPGSEKELPADLVLIAAGCFWEPRRRLRKLSRWRRPPVGRWPTEL